MSIDDALSAREKTVYERLLAAEVRRLREERNVWRSRAHSVEESANKLARARDAIATLIDMQHEDSLIRVGDIRAALRGAD